MLPKISATASVCFLGRLDGCSFLIGLDGEFKQICGEILRREPISECEDDPS